MLDQAKAFWDSLAGKVRQTVREETENALRMQRYTVSTAPNGSVIGVTLPYGTNELLIPYSQEVDSATAGDVVLVAWWGNMSNAKVYYFADGYRGGSSGGGAQIGTITTTTTWTTQADDWTQTVTVTGATVTSNSKVDLQPDTTVLTQMLSDGCTALYVENNAGTLTLHALGAGTSVALTIQATVTEVTV